MWTEIPSILHKSYTCKVRYPTRTYNVHQLNKSWCCCFLFHCEQGTHIPQTHCVRYSWKSESCCMSVSPLILLWSMQCWAQGYQWHCNEVSHCHPQLLDWDTAVTLSWSVNNIFIIYDWKEIRVVLQNTTCMPLWYNWKFLNNVL